MARLQSDVSAGKAAKKGAATQAAGDKPLAPVPAQAAPRNDAGAPKYPPRPIRPRGVGSYPSTWLSGRSNNAENRAELRGHQDATADAARARGNSPLPRTDQGGPRVSGDLT